jgi:hypothetical protein
MYWRSCSYHLCDAYRGGTVQSMLYLASLSESVSSAVSFPHLLIDLRVSLIYCSSVPLIPSTLVMLCMHLHLHACLAKPETGSLFIM